MAFGRGGIIYSIIDFKVSKRFGCSKLVCFKTAKVAIQIAGHIAIDLNSTSESDIR